MIELIAEQVLDASQVEHGGTISAKVFTFVDRIYVKKQVKINDSSLLITITDVKANNVIYNGNQPTANSAGVQVFYSLKVYEDNKHR